MKHTETSLILCFKILFLDIKEFFFVYTMLYILIALVKATEDFVHVNPKEYTPLDDLIRVGSSGSLLSSVTDSLFTGFGGIDQVFLKKDDSKNNKKASSKMRGDDDSSEKKRGDTNNSPLDEDSDS